MCLGTSFSAGNHQTVYELHGFRRCGIYSIFQILLTLLGIIIIAVGEALFGTDLIINIIIGGIIIILFNILPNGKPFFLNLYRMGRVYIMFDGNNREIILVSTHFGGLKTKQKIISSYSQFRGIAMHHTTHHILLLCKREESLLLKQIGDILPDHKESMQSVLEEISLYWFQKGLEGFFGITYVDFSEGIVAENNIRINIDYDYYLKRSETWKPKNNMMEQNGGPHKKQKHNENVNVMMEDDQYLGAKYAKKERRFDSVNGASIDVGSDDDIVHDYV